MELHKKYYDAIVIGGGFYGCSIAIELKKSGKSVVLLEKEPDLMQRASYANQARIHQGYHYPRSILTAFRSRVNFDKFTKEFSECVHSNFDKYYIIGKKTSHINAEQFQLFCNRIGAPLQKAPKKINDFFNPELVEKVYKVQEYAFNTVKLKEIMLDLLNLAKVDIELNSTVVDISQPTELLKLNYFNEKNENSLEAKYIINCTYSGINQINNNSGLTTVPLKHELTEMALLKIPEELKNTGFTVMDGPFFSIMPFPARDLHTLSHVRYTPHCYWQEGNQKSRTGTQPLLNIHSTEDKNKIHRQSSYAHMIKDAERYMPILKECQYFDSIWETKTVLPQSEVDDSRPILFQRDETLSNVVSVMGGKIDNIFDIREKLKILLNKEWSE